MVGWLEIWMVGWVDGWMVGWSVWWPSALMFEGGCAWWWHVNGMGCCQSWSSTIAVVLLQANVGIGNRFAAETEAHADGGGGQHAAQRREHSIVQLLARRSQRGVALRSPLYVP